MGFAEDISNATRRAMCSWSRIGNAFGPNFPIPQSPFGRALELWTCDIPPENSDGGVINIGQPALPNGQCVGSYYNIQGDWSFQNIESGNITTNPFSLGGSIANRIYGPIRGLGYTSEGGETTGFFIKASDINGNPQDYTGQGRQAAPGTKFLNATISTITYRGGNGDDCGGRPPVPPTVDDTIPDPDGGPDINITLRPNVPIFLPGSVTLFPVTIEGPNFTFNVTYNASSCECDITPEIPDENPPIVPTVPDVPLTEDELGEELPNVLLGVIVTGNRNSQGTTATEIFQESAPNIFAPRIANVTFRYKVGNSSPWGSDIPVKNLNNFIPAPGPFAAVGVAITPIPGFNLSVLPVYRPTDDFIIE